MKISVKDVKRLNEKLANKMESYENDYLTHYYYFHTVEKHWYSEEATLFYQTLQDDLKNEQNTLEFFKRVHKIYDFLVSSYSEIGNVIEYEKSYKESILNVLDELILITDKIIGSYNDIGIYNYSERSMLYSQKNSFMNVSSNLKLIRNRLDKNMTKIDDIEHTSKCEFEALWMNPVKEKEINEFIRHRW